jgi:hypothetical protein
VLRWATLVSTRANGCLHVADLAGRIRLHIDGLPDAECGRGSGGAVHQKHEEQELEHADRGCERVQWVRECARAGDLCGRAVQAAVQDGPAEHDADAGVQNIARGGQGEAVVETLRVGCVYAVS